MTTPGPAGVSNPDAVLVVGPSWVGDMVMAQSLFKSLKARSPGSAIDVLAPGWSLPLLARMPEVRRGVEMPLGHGRLGLAERWRLGRSLRGQLPPGDRAAELLEVGVGALCGQDPAAHRLAR